MRLLANNDPEVQRLGLSAEDVASAAWTVDVAHGGALERDGVGPEVERADSSPAFVRLRGAAAINRVLDELGGGWALVARAYRCRAIARLEDRAYGVVARHRGLLRPLAWLLRAPRTSSGPGVPPSEPRR